MTIKIRLSQALEEYKAHMEARGMAHGTIRGRVSLLGMVKTDIGDIYTENIDGRHIDQVFAAHAWGPKTRNVKLSQMRHFFRWCQSRRYMDRHEDPLAGWRNLIVPNEPRTRIPVEEWPRLFDACLHPTEEIALATGLFLFLRGSEQQHIQMKHINLDAGEIEIFRQKTRQWDTMPISTELDFYLRKYLIWYAEQTTIHPDHYLHAPRVLTSQERDPVTNRIVPGTGTIDPTRSITKPHITIQRILKRAGYETAKEGEHTLRRSGARAYFDHLAESGYDGALRRCQAMLGHSTSLITENYLGLDLDRRQRNEDIAGHRMFPNLITADIEPDAPNVVSINRAKEQADG